MLVGVMVGDPIGFTVLKHVYHFETEILFKGLQNNFYFLKCPYFSLIISLAGVRTPLFRQCRKFRNFFLIASLRHSI